MIPSELNGTLIFADTKRNSLSVIKTKIVSKLNALKERTSITDNIITFKTIEVKIASGIANSPSGYLLFRIYKEGKIIIEKEDNVLAIKWSVKLDTLYFIATYCSVAVGIIVSLYANTNLLFSVSIGIGIFTMFISLGILLIKYKLTELIEACVYGNN